jgi:hypothetical protein
MNNLFQSFPMLPMTQQVILIFWSLCVVMFYSSLLFILVDVFFKTIKKTL